MKFINCLLYTALLTGISWSATAQYSSKDSIWVKKMTQQALKSDHAYNDLRVLCKDIGHRLSGSPQSFKAITWAQQALKNAGADTVWLQPVRVPVWERGKEYLKLYLDGKMTEVEVLSLGNLHGTDGKELKAEVVMLHSLEELQNAAESLIKNKIVFMNVPFPVEEANTFDGYSKVARIRTRTASLVCAKGGKGVIIRSISTTKDEVPHTGAAHYSDEHCKVPGMAIGNNTADRLAKAIAKGKTEAIMMSNARMKEEVLSYNIIGELKGSTSPDKYLLVGGHIDSWDIGEGAHDDGAGCVQSIQVMRNFKSMNYQPKNTLRVVLFMNEENGNRGGIAYADSATKRKEQHVFALESDAGGFTPRGIGMIADESYRAQAKSWLPILKPLGLYEFDVEGCGVDVSPLKNTGVKAGELLPDNQRYFDIHHCRHDVFEAVNERELNLGTAGMSAFLYLVDQYWQ